MTTPFCPHCGGSNIERRTTRPGGPAAADDHRWRCKDCPEPFDDPDRRDVDASPGRGGLSPAGRAAIEHEQGESA